MIQFYNNRNEIFSGCAGAAEVYITPIRLASDLWLYLTEEVIDIELIDCNGSVIADFGDTHLTDPTQYTASIFANDSSGNVFTYVRFGENFNLLELPCESCFYVRVRLRNDTYLVSETVQVTCCNCEYTRINSRYTEFDHLGRYYGEPCNVTVQYPEHELFDNTTLVCATLSLISFNNSRTTATDASCIAAKVGSSEVYKLIGRGLPDYRAREINTVLMGNQLAINDLPLQITATDFFKEANDCECLFYLDATLNTCPNIIDLTCSDTVTCCLTIYVPNSGTTDIDLTLNGINYTISCVKDNTPICEIDGIPFTTDNQPTNIVLSNNSAYFDYECNVPTCCVLFIVSRSTGYAGAGVASYSFTVNGVTYTGSNTVTEVGNFPFVRLCFTLNTVVTLNSVTADGVTTVYPGTGTQIEANHLDGQNRKLFSAVLINECGVCSCQDITLVSRSFDLPSANLYIWFVNQLGSPYTQNSIFLLFNNSSDRHAVYSFINSCQGNYIRISNGSNIFGFKKDNLTLGGIMPTSAIPIPVPPATPIPLGYDFAMQYFYIAPQILPSDSCAVIEQGYADFVATNFQATLLASNNLKFPMTLVECQKVIDDCGIYPPPCTLQILTITQNCLSGGAGILVEVTYVAPSMTGTVTITVKDTLPPFNDLIAPFTIPAISEVFTFILPLGTANDFEITITSDVDAACNAAQLSSPISCNDCTDCIANSVFSEVLVSGASGMACTGAIVLKYLSPPPFSCDWILCSVTKVITIGSSFEVFPTNADPVCTAITVTQTGTGEFLMENAGAGTYNCVWRLDNCSKEECQMDNFGIIAPIQLRRCTFFTPDGYDWHLKQYVNLTGGFTLRYLSVLKNGIEQLPVAPLDVTVTSLTQLANESVPLQKITGGSKFWNIWVGFCSAFNALVIPNTRMIYGRRQRLGGVAAYGGDPFRLEYLPTDTISILFEVYNGLAVLQWSGLWETNIGTGTVINGTQWSPPLDCYSSDVNGNFPCESNATIYVECKGSPNPDSILIGFDGVPLQEGESVVRQWRINGGAWVTPPFAVPNEYINHSYSFLVTLSDPTYFVTGFNTIELLLQHLPNGFACITVTETKTITFDNTNPNSVCQTMIIS